MARPIKVLTKARSRKVLRAVARHIARFPNLYRFMSTSVPRRGDCGCMLGRAGAIMRTTTGNFGVIARKLRFDDDMEFYQAMERLLPRGNVGAADAPEIVKGLRRLAATI